MCDKCEGSGVIFNPIWTQFFTEAGAALQWVWDDTQAVRELQETYLGKPLPPQCVACGCRTAGTLEAEKKHA